MSNKYLDAIATVDISIDSPLIVDVSFDKVLIVGPLPSTTPKELPEKVAEYSSIDAVEKAGWAVTGDTDPVGVAARVAFSQKKKPDSIFIAYVDKEEKAVEAVKTAMGTSGWYVVCPVGINESEYEDIAEYIETTEKLFCYTELNFFKNKGVPTVSNEYARTYFIYGKQTKDQEDESIPAENKCMNVAWNVSTLLYQSGSETFAYKNIALCKPAELSLDDIKTITAKGTCLVTIGNKNVTLGGLVLAGEWIDVIRFRDWLKNDMQVNVVNTFVTTPKIPYTDSGIGLIQNQMLASLKKGQDNGGIAPEEYDEDGNPIPAYATSVPRASSLSATEKSTRVLKNCKFGARLSGAIHVAKLNGDLSYAL